MVGGRWLNNRNLVGGRLFSQPLVGGRWFFRSVVNGSFGRWLVIFLGKWSVVRGRWSVVGVIVVGGWSVVLYYALWKSQESIRSISYLLT